MKAMLGIFLYSYPQLNLQKRFVFLIRLVSSTKLEIKAEQDLPRTEGGRGKGWGWVQEGEMTQTMYAHVNKRI
jgi:hypothetical protein